MDIDAQTTLLTTVNAPYQSQLDAAGLAAALKNGDVGLGQVASFFTETAIDAQKAFAQAHEITSDTLMQIAGDFQDLSGQHVALVD